MGRFGSPRPARLRRTALETALTASSWPMTRLAEALFHLHELFAFAFEHARDGDAGPARDDFGDFVAGDFFLHQRVAALWSAREIRFSASSSLALKIAQFAILNLGRRLPSCPAAAPVRARPAFCRSAPADRLDRAHRAFFIFPAGVEAESASPASRPVPARPFQAAACWRGLFPSAGLRSRSEAASSAAGSHPARPASNRFRSADATRLRRSDRSPCPAGIDPGCSDRTRPRRETIAPSVMRTP